MLLGHLLGWYSVLPMSLPPSPRPAPPSGLISPSTAALTLQPLLDQSAPIPLSIEIFRQESPHPLPRRQPSHVQCASLWGWALSFLSEVPLHAGPPFSSCSVHTGDAEQIVLTPGDSPPDKDDSATQPSQFKGDTCVRQWQVLSPSLGFSVSPFRLLAKVSETFLLHSSSPGRRCQVALMCSGRLSHPGSMLSN